MKPGWPRQFSRVRNASLYKQIAFLLTIAVFPIGVIAVLQALNSVEEGRKLQAAALLGETIHAAGVESAIIDTARGVARALGTAALHAGPDSPLCSDTLEQFASRSVTYTFAGFIGLDGKMNCVSSGDGFDLSKNARFVRLLERPRPMARVLEYGPVSKQKILQITEPISEGGTVRGFLMISIPYGVVTARALAQDGENVFDMVLVDGDGNVVARRKEEKSRIELPPAWALKPHLQGGGSTFVAPLADGRTSTFSVASVLDGDIYAVATWSTANGQPSAFADVFSALIVPVTMWLIGLAVSYLAMHRLVIRHVTRLVRMMSEFEGGKRNIEGLILRDAPEEIRALGSRFASLTSTITQDETEQQRALEEKTILLREINHRVKNNLQLIVSIMNMQVRHSRSGDVRNALKRLQERVSSLAAVHARLYTSADFVSIRADTVLSDIVQNLVHAAVDTSGKVQTVLDIAPVELTPDQAVPVTLFVSETVTNAIKHGLGANGGTLKVSLREIDTGRVTLRVSNSMTAAPDAQPLAQSTGVGSHLIEGFAGQLYATLRQDTTDDFFHVSLTFDLEPLGLRAPFAPSARRSTPA
ncbi:sensor histidine kinase [Paroceanicella profunda]|uniref:histidine kinase n=1 Tax=Paroceanicella profunda TaxID=2579971 RepID=A0A5B8FH33_9RHOB|nr:histidine kinase dimerization/phosphoacceptor domain -containing protein [Paroceanicella profunda]QDL91727.1 sensor histidine kinase [Paroceanicella profunda]